VYLNDYDAIENNFKVLMFGNRKLLRVEERSEIPNQYDILKKVEIKFPKRFNKPEDIDCLVIVKVLEKERGFERAFFLVKDYAGYKHTSKRLIDEGRITKEALANAVIEEFVVGAQVNLNYFYSPMENRLELIGTDTRRQTNLDGILRLPQNYQTQLMEDKKVMPSYEEAGHIAVTVLESLLEQVFAIGEKFVKASREMFPPGVIGPFGLQTVITAGPPKKEIVVFDVAPRMPGSPGIAATPYSSYLYGRPVSMGERVAMEIKEAIKKNLLDKITT
jgi:5-formaminoimidazole-4-carboxamide-1-(beta)-D-ribofuranosyl 5'-monophosphate synthetase